MLVPALKALPLAKQAQLIAMLLLDPLAINVLDRLVATRPFLLDNNVQ